MNAPAPTQSTPLQQQPRGPQKLKYTHQAMVDLILADPTVTFVELGEVFGYSAAWVSRVVASDAFQARLAERKQELVDPAIAQSLNERVQAVTIQSLHIVGQKLEAEQSAAYAMEALGVVALLHKTAGAGKHAR